ncbi:hypothetical protein NP493_218g03019 [Ridgeia piscesae]|uniref:Uncharacterized protein n=1 Tax=Ridgeia piscesae TaxID=27915 RepID=A0AAD9P0N3_RIDPI|nr:hypothetical protein NP493_218g03019 [Ridgeia piscesae]
MFLPNYTTQYTYQYTSHNKHTRNAAEKQRATTLCSQTHLYKINIKGALRNINGTDCAYRMMYTLKQAPESDAFSVQVPPEGDPSTTK